MEKIGCVVVEIDGLRGVDRDVKVLRRGTEFSFLICSRLSLMAAGDNLFNTCTYSDMVPVFGLR